MEEQVVKLGDIIRATINRWKLILLVAIICTLGAGALGALSKEEMTFQGTLKIAIKNSAVVLDNGMQVKKDDKLVTNYIELMKTRDYMGEVAKNVDPEYKLTPEIILGKTKITNISGSDFIQVVYTGSTENETVEVMQAMSDEFKAASSSLSPSTEYLIGDNITITKQVNIRNNKMIVLIGLVGGIALGVFIAFVLECLNRTFRTKGEIERILKMNVIGIVPAVKKETAKTMATVTESTVVLDEAYNGIATNIKYSSLKEKRVILITSSILGEGASTTASRLAQSLAAGNDKVVLIDANLRNSGIGRDYGKENEKGLSEVVLGKAKLSEVLQPINENLSLLPSGNIKVNPITVIDSEKVDSILNELRAEYDYVIIDSAPVKVAADATILSTKVDGIVLVVRSGKSKYDTVKETVNEINNVNGSILGIVFNGADTFVNKFYRY